MIRTLRTALRFSRPALRFIAQKIADNPGAVLTVGLGLYAHWTWRQFLEYISRSRLPISAGMATIAAMYAIYTQRSEITVLARQQFRRRSLQSAMVSQVPTRRHSVSIL